MKTQPKLSFKINSDSQDKSYLTIPIGEFAEVKGGIGFPVELQGENTTEIPFFKVSDMELAGNERELLNANNYVSLKSLSENLKCNFFDKPAVVFAKVGAALLLDRKRICRSKFLIDNNMMAVMPNTDICKLEYLYYDLLNKKLSNLSNTGALPSINAYQIKEVVVKLPCIEEQQKIAEFFTALDEKIRCLDDLAKGFSQSMQGVLNKVFTQQISFKDENGNNYSEWTIKKIKDIAPLQRGFDLPTSQLQDGECTVIYSNGQTAKHSAFKCDGCAVVTGRS
ncbi:MAG: restriction endonuclease subunit S, partial [Anaerobiospirillum succiniciproducens]|uniref:restriction endonuclease subunit S n=1 Tax=Anaerobiospirillum succiniciproducens TaxID=13335 RepID=UPI002A76371F